MWGGVMSRGRGMIAALVVVALLLVVGGDRLMNSESFQLFGGLTGRVETERKVVALTFDDGPTCDDVEAVLTALGDAPGTFFVNGRSMQQCPDGARRIAAAGHELGNHTWDHRRMVFVAPATVREQIEATDAQIRGAGYEDEVLFRPPHGKKLVVLPWWLHQHDRRTIMWDVAAETWDDSEPQSTEDIVHETVRTTRPGSIILLHPWRGRTHVQRAIPQVIAQLEDQGYTLVTVSDALRAGPE